jgi:hypothetical protein
VELGLPLLEDFDDPQAAEGAAAITVNAVGAVRWNLPRSSPRRPSRFGPIFPVWGEP